VRVVLQRVSEASVMVEGASVGSIGRGVLLLVAVGKEDTGVEAAKMAEKCANIRVFADEKGHFERSLVETGGEVLAVSQFTLYGDCRKGRRPSLSHAARPEEAEALFQRFVDEVKGWGLRVATGKFGAMMRVHLVNDGPVTFLLET